MKLFVLLVLVVVAINGEYVRVCYYTNWSQYRPEGKKFFPENIDETLCTHIVYAFGIVDKDLHIKPYEWNDESTAWSAGMYERTLALKAKNPSLKVLLAVGGWNHGVGGFGYAVGSETNRTIFAENAMEYLRLHQFDGLDLDWEYPGSRGSLSHDKQRFTLFVKKLREEFNAEPASSGKSTLLLTAAVPAGKSNTDNGYEISEISNYLDYIFLMSYDLHGAWDNFLGHNSPLYARPDESEPQSYLNQDWAVNYWTGQGAPKKKLVMGLATYGRCLEYSESPVLGAPALGAARAGPFTREAGFMSYYEICKNLNNGWVREWNDFHKAPYAYSANEWCGYDDVFSFEIKLDYIISNGLAGAMIWALDLDDFTGSCGQGSYPLLNVMKNKLGGSENPHPPPANPTTTTTTTTTATTKSPTPSQASTTSASGVGSCGQPDECPEGMYIPDTCNPAVAYQCYHGGANTIQCGHNLVWNSVQNACVWASPALSACSEYNNQGGTPDCLNQGEQLPDTCDALCYYNCVDGEPIRHCCSSGFYWDDSLKRCQPNHSRARRSDRLRRRIASLLLNQKK